MDERQQRTLLTVARAAVEAAVRGEPMTLPECDDPALLARCGCFVTLKQGDRLRGCIGQFTSDRPLLHLVAQMARAAAREDPRFVHERLRVADLDRLHVEISVLSPLRRTDDPASLRLGVDGVYVRRGSATGCFLPQVATETGWSAEQFLSMCCTHKAGLPADAWRDPRTEVYLFTAEVFGADWKDIPVQPDP